MLKSGLLGDRSARGGSAGSLHGSRLPIPIRNRTRLRSNGRRGLPRAEGSFAVPASLVLDEPVSHEIALIIPSETATETDRQVVFLVVFDVNCAAAIIGLIGEP